MAVEGACVSVLFESFRGKEGPWVFLEVVSPEGKWDFQRQREGPSRGAAVCGGWGGSNVHTGLPLAWLGHFAWSHNAWVVKSSIRGAGSHGKLWATHRSAVLGKAIQGVRENHRPLQQSWEGLRREGELGERKHRYWPEGKVAGVLWQFGSLWQR